MAAAIASRSPFQPFRCDRAVATPYTSHTSRRPSDPEPLLRRYLPGPREYRPYAVGLIRAHKECQQTWDCCLGSQYSHRSPCRTVPSEKIRVRDCPPFPRPPVSNAATRCNRRVLHQVPCSLAPATSTGYSELLGRRV